MGEHLDIDDAVAGNPEAERELAELRDSAQRAEAECERLRGDMQAINDEGRSLRQGGPYADGAQDLHDALESAVGIAYVAMQRRRTPPPEGEPTLMETALRECKLAGNAELAEFWGNAPHTPKQAHGDALAAFDRIENWVGERSHLPAGIVAMPREREIVRRNLTASGVPDHWACKNPGRADQYRAEALACRRALGFDEESQDVSPSDLASGIAASGVPYVPENIKRLPGEYRAKGREFSLFSTEYNIGRAHLAFSVADRIEAALASAPTVQDTRIDEARRLLEQSAEPFDRACTILREIATAPEVPDGMRTAWPTRDVLTKLAEAADILLDRYNHDDDGWGMIAHARDVARERAAAPTDGRE